MRTTTPEGFRVNVPRETAARITPCLRTLGLDRLVGRRTSGDLEAAVERTLTELARRSRYAGRMVYPDPSRGFATFTVPLAGDRYRLLARPASEGELEVAMAFSAEAADRPEFAAQPVSGAATVRWDHPVSLSNAIQGYGNRRGLYVVETDLQDGRGWRPLYIGQGRIADELRREVRSVNHASVVNPQAQFRVRVGFTRGRTTLTRPQIETTLLRRAARTGHNLANDNHQYRRPMLIPAGGSVRVTHQGPTPPYLRPGGRRVHRLSGGPRSGHGRQYEAFAIPALL